MFPMISEPWEFDAAKAVFDGQLAWLRGQKKQLPEAVKFGAMLEVPALAEMLDVLCPKLTFLSVGTNDLTQFLFARTVRTPSWPSVTTGSAPRSCVFCAACRAPASMARC
jgi:phosphotransferase system enzyme I (PtsP)